MDGYIFIHGKHSGCEYDDGSLYKIANSFKNNYLVSFETYPWGVDPWGPDIENRKLYPRMFEDCVDQIDQSVKRLTEQGADRIFLVGHSIGGNACLYYATLRTNFTGIVLLAPAHNLHINSYAQLHRSSVIEAKKMIDKGQGDQIGHFIDLWQDGYVYVIRTQAKNYYSIMNAAGSGNMQLNAPKILKPINVLCISGTDDISQKEFGRTIYNIMPKTDKSKMVIVKGDHLSICNNEDIIVNWSNTI
jgi:esterase/lipase